MKTYEYKTSSRHFEIDSSLHVNNANFLRYLEEARVQMMNEQGLQMEKILQANVELVLYKYVCYYKKQIRYPENLIIKSKQIQTKRIRGLLRQEIYLEDGSLCFQADAYWAFNAKFNVNINDSVIFTQLFGQNPYENIDPFTVKKDVAVNEILPHITTKIEVRPYEIDSFQHANNAVYANYFEIGRWNFRRLLFPDLQYFKKMDLIFVLYKCKIQYQKPSTLFESLTLKTWLIEISPLRVIYWQEITNDSGALHASCRSEGCIVNKLGQPTKISPEILLAYKSMLAR